MMRALLIDPDARTIEPVEHEPYPDGDIQQQVLQRPGRPLINVSKRLQLTPATVCFVDAYPASDAPGWAWPERGLEVRGRGLALGLTLKGELTDTHMLPWLAIRRLRWLAPEPPLRVDTVFLAGDQAALL